MSHVSDHLGPVSTYMTSCNGDCTKFNNPSGAQWFKVDAAGYDSSKKQWASDKLIQGKLNINLSLSFHIQCEILLTVKNFRRCFLDQHDPCFTSPWSICMCQSQCLMLKFQLIFFHLSLSAMRSSHFTRQVNLSSTRFARKHL